VRVHRRSIICERNDADGQARTVIEQGAAVPGGTGDLALMRMHIGALYTHDPAGRIVRVNEPGGTDAPRFFLGRTVEGIEWRVRHDVEPELVESLAAACGAERSRAGSLSPPTDTTRYLELLARFAPVQHTEAGPAYRFPSELRPGPDPIVVTSWNVEVLRPHLEAWLGDVGRCDPMLVCLHAGRAIAICASVRITDVAHEAGVETAPDFRGRGYATQVVSAWARAVRGMGRIPLYSTSWRNDASRAVARSLGLLQFGADLHIT
jgi:RimJ/RimL family protein N-acetyltransferase